jgi:HipA-like protein
MPTLNVWMNGELVGKWTTSRTGTPILRYDDSWIQSRRVRALSLSLPITPDREIRGNIVDYYFDNLLPDNQDIRRRIRERYGLKSTDAFDLLEEIGRDCAGAIQLLPPDRKPAYWDKIEGTPLSAADVGRELQAVAAPASFGRREDDDGFRISIAGARRRLPCSGWATLGIDHVTRHQPLISSNYRSALSEISGEISHILSRTNGSARNSCRSSSFRSRTLKLGNSAVKRPSSFSDSIEGG